jgi:hydrogenase maturation protein HypF
MLATPPTTCPAAEPAAPDATAGLQRRAVRVRGAVQGVGFRPGVLRLAQALGLQGWVLNDAHGVALEAQGPAAALAEFERRLVADAPPLARVASIEVEALALNAAEPAGFRILPSRAVAGGAAGRVDTAIPPDTTTCAACLDELCDPADRRWRHPFINCTQCGPRFTLTRQLPYDRAQTSMAAFAMCAACLHEYRTPADRRFHAEPNACPQCGPRLQLVGADGQPVLPPGADAIAATLALLRGGSIVGIKGLGGFHLACDARNARAVALLRQRKQREAKPFAVMASSLASAAQWVQLDAAACALLASPERPIVLLPREPGAPSPLAGVAPGLQQLGVMLPCTPVQFLLFHEAAGCPAGTAWLHQAKPLLLVMTSANPGGEPLVKDNAEALDRLQGIADAWLLHDRDILARCDDSVLQPMPVALDTPAATRSQFVRRARGYTPQAIALPHGGPSVLACGAWLKNTVCITRGDQAYLSPHIGDLDTASACQALEAAVHHLRGVLGVEPQALAHDLHPDFFSSQFAQAWALREGLPVMGVQHHHAHIAAVAAEHGVREPLLGLALDGVGLGTDGGAWGGELLRLDGPRMQRLAHLATLPLPGGDAAARQPWRMAAAALHGLGRGHEIAGRWPQHPAAAMLPELLQRGLRCPPTSSLGRWFDAAAGLLGVCETSAFEGQAPMLLQALASTCHVLPAADTLDALTPLRDDGSLDLYPLLDWLADAQLPGRAAAGAQLFHHALASGLARWVGRHAAVQRLQLVALGGGCCLNTLLCGLLVPQLQAQGLRVLQAERAPPNDGGIALGQAWVALQTLNEH